ncbi:unnamed protein product [Effrenium voratum]|nr:unnamed protein product [Effrenium voratum]
MVQVLSGPACAGEQLLSFEHYRGSARREAFYSRMLWAIDLIRGFHQRILSMAGEVTGAASSVFYLPSFFGLLIALQDEESLRCLIQASATITQSSLYWRNLGYDHFYVHGMEYPVVTDFDFAWGKPQARDEAKLWIVQAFYASTRNMAILTTGELSHGLVSTLAANLYTMRRVVNIPFMLRDGVEELEERRRFRLSFAGSVQAHNFERVLFLRAAAAEFPPLVNGSIWTVSNPKLQLKALVQLNASEPLDHTQRGACFQRRWLKWLYRRSELCVCAPGDAPALGQRLADVVAAGCIPVVLAGPGTVPVLPLQGAVRWEDFAVILRLGDDVSSGSPRTPGQHESDEVTQRHAVKRRASEGTKASHCRSARRLARGARHQHNSLAFERLKWQSHET